MQQITNKKLSFPLYDFGTDCANLTRYKETCNQAAYGSLTPPEYDLTAITAPVVIMQGAMPKMLHNPSIQPSIERQLNLARFDSNTLQLQSPASHPPPPQTKTHPHHH